MIGSSENRISYNGNGIATEFAYNFIIIEKSDIKVLHVAADGTEELLTTDYYVDMEKSVVLYPGYAPGAEIPEQNRPPILPVGERLVIYREVPITQDSALDKHWPFNVVESGLDKLTIICQQIWDRLQRSFYVSESTSSNFDPKVPIEAGKTFRVKDDGTGFEVTEDPLRAQQVAVSAKNDAEKARDAAQLARDTARAWAEENAGTTPSLIGGAKSSKQWSEHIHGYVDTAVEDARIAKETAIKSSEFVGNIVSGELYNIYSSVADMKADTTLMAGQTVKTVGYYEVNDGGGAFYYIRAKLTDDVDDGGSVHELSNGLVAELIIENGTINVKQFGAKGDGASDDTLAISCSISKCYNLYFPNGIYQIGSPIVINKAIIITGGSQSNTIIKYTGTPTSITPILQIANINNVNNLVIKNMKIQSNSKNNVVGIAIGSASGHLTDSKFENITLYNLAIGITTEYSWCDIFENVRILSCSQPLQLNNQTNNILFTKCNFTGYTTISKYVNCLGITFLECSFENGTGLFYSFQSKITFINPYWEFIETISSYHLELNSGGLTVIGGCINEATWKIHSVNNPTLNLEESLFTFKLFANKWNSISDKIKLNHQKAAKLVSSFSVHKKNSINQYKNNGVLVNKDGVICFNITSAINGSSGTIGRTAFVAEKDKHYCIKYKVKSNEENTSGVHFIVDATTDVDGNQIALAELWGTTSDNFDEKVIYVYNPFNDRNVLFALKETGIYLEYIDVYEVGADMYSKNDKCYSFQAPTDNSFVAGDVIFNDFSSVTNCVGWYFNGSTWTAF